MPSPETIERFIARVEQNAHVDAIREFYTEEASMQENNGPPRVGRDLLIKHEREVLSRANSVISTCVRPVLVNGNTVVVGGFFSSSGKMEALREWKSLPISAGKESASPKSNSFMTPHSGSQAQGPAEEIAGSVRIGL
jgi:hypothetical protein